MAACFTEWTVLPHDPIEKLTENFWCVQGVMPDDKTTRKMSIIRMRDGSLLVHNAIALEEEAMQEPELNLDPTTGKIGGGPRTALTAADLSQSPGRSTWGRFRR